MSHSLGKLFGLLWICYEPNGHLLWRHLDVRFSVKTAIINFNSSANVKLF